MLGRVFKEVAVKLDSARPKNNDAAAKKKPNRSNRSAKQIAQVAVALQEELAIVKRIVRHIANHDLQEGQQRVFKVEKTQLIRRLVPLGITGHHPAISAKSSGRKWLKPSLSKRWGEAQAPKG